MKGQLGLEKTIEEYITKLCDIFDEAKRVLRKDGTCWVNLGDSYSGGAGHGGNTNKKHTYNVKVNRGKSDISSKSLCLIPQRFAIEMVNRGWILRNTIIWHKPNCMPSSAKDRFTVDFEYVYFFVKNNKTLFWINEVTGELRNIQPLSKKGIEGKDWHWLNNKKVSLWRGHNYWFEQQIEKTSAKLIEPRMMRGEGRRTYNGKYPEAGVVRSMSKNKRTVWTISTRPFPGAHFAVFPEKLIELMIQAGCPKYVCKKCGKARVKIYKTIGKQITKSMRTAGCDKEGKYKGTDQKDYKSAFAQRPSETKKRILESMSQVKESYYSDCGCNAEFEGGIVLDPFMGAGTTAVVAKKQGKQYLGIELKQEYIDMANKRIRIILESLF